jgi:hypothetical protein
MRALLLTALFTAGCTPSRAVKPLPAGTGAITASLGGPLISDLGPTIPLPLTSIGYMHGLDGKTNLYGSLHPTSLAAFRVFGASLGASRQLWEQQGLSPRLMTGVTLYGFAGDAVDGGDGPAGRVFGDVSAMLSWDLGRHTVYTGAGLFVQPAPTFAAHVTPTLGAQLQPGRLGVQLEAEWLAPYVDNRPLAASWRGIGHHGALQLSVGLSFRLGKTP